MTTLAIPRYRLVVDAKAHRRIKIGSSVIVDFDAGTVSRNDGVAIATLDEHTYGVSRMILRREAGRAFHFLEGACEPLHLNPNARCVEYLGPQRARHFVRRVARAKCDAAISMLAALLAVARDLAPDIVPEIERAIEWARAAWKEAISI